MVAEGDDKQWNHQEEAATISILLICLEEESILHCEIDSEYELKKYWDESSSERKRLYHEIIEFKTNIWIFCRCRPLRVIETGNTSTVNFESTLLNEH
ncbi:hypothetical protein RYX36_036234 [Vicia faba]